MVGLMDAMLAVPKAALKGISMELMMAESKDRDLVGWSVHRTENNMAD